jgi:hypothetical protein
MNQLSDDASEPTGQPADLAMELLERGFTKPVVVDALVVDGVDRDVAREIVTSLQKARFRMHELERIAARQYKSRALMALGGGILLYATWWFFGSVGGHMGRPLVTKAVVFTFSTGFFLFLYGFTLRKRF